MRLLIDANILLDVLMKRGSHYRNSSLIWKLCESDLVTGYVSALTIANLVYIMRKELDPETTDDIIRKLGLIFNITDLLEADIMKAAGYHWKDYEDALQSVIAQRLQTKFIITRNIDDFENSSVKAITTAEFLDRITL